MMRIVIVLVLLIIGIQFIPVSRTNRDVVSDFDGPAEVKAILQRSCYDCHSNETQWPWYSRLAPVSWFVTHHVQDGREHLNFSDWEAIKDIRHIREEIFEEAEEGEMPPQSYLLMHSGAKLSGEDLETLKKWAVE